MLLWYVPPPATCLGRTYHNLIYLLLYICTAISHGNIRLVATKKSKYSMDKIRPYKSQSDCQTSETTTDSRRTGTEVGISSVLFCFPNSIKFKIFLLGLLGKYCHEISIFAPAFGNTLMYSVT